MNQEDLITLFCLIDDFCKSFEITWKKILIENKEGKNLKKATRRPWLSLSEMMTILIYFHSSGYRTFKHYYQVHVLGYLRSYFPRVSSYSRFVQLTPRTLFAIFCFSQVSLGSTSGISFIDSTLLTVCHNRRIYSHKVFKGLAKRGKTTTGWFFGFKLHLVINDLGEIIAYMLTEGNTDDRKPVKELCKKVFGKLFGDKGYLSSTLFSELYEAGIQLITKLKSNMKNKLMNLYDKFLLRKRRLIESVHNRLKNGCQIEHHRHRSRWNFLVNLLSGISSYEINPNKPTLKLRRAEISQILLVV
jgi:hypothetical protein